jgi:hypothetical protein
VKHITLLSAVALLATSTAIPSYAQDYYSPNQGYDSDLISLGAGFYDIGGDDSAGDFRLEYRWGSPFFWEIKPWAGGELTSDGSIWAGGGVLADFDVADHLVITPSFGIGLYNQGSSDLDLDYPIEFRSQIEAGYRFDNDNRIGIQFGHISNASLGDDNPGVEILGLYWHIPTNQVFH